MIKIASVWSQKTKGGITYYKGRLGNADVLVFPNRSEHPKSPDFDILIAKHEQYEASQQSHLEDPPKDPPMEGEPPF